MLQLVSLAIFNQPSLYPFDVIAAAAAVPVFACVSSFGAVHKYTMQKSSQRKQLRRIE
jgi:hypothetical protein